MLFLRTIATPSPEPEVWTACAELRSDVATVLDALTDPTLIACWAPVSFEVDGLAGRRLRAGSRERVRGSIGGIRTVFEVEVRRADAAGLELVASGPVELHVAYRFRERDDGVDVETAVSILRQGGITASVLRAAVAALMNAGALRMALRRLESSLPLPAEPELLAA